jgi:hypothetical protein
LASHLQHEEPDRQTRERGEWAGRRGQPVGEDDRLARFGLDVADVPRHADRQADQRGRPRPDPLPGRPAIEIGDVEGEFAHGQEHVDLGRPRGGLPAAQPVMDRPII